MSRNITTMTQVVLGPGHVIEDPDPTPICHRGDHGCKACSGEGKKKEETTPNPPITEQE